MVAAVASQMTARVAARVVAAVFAAGTENPLPPVDQNPEDVRRAACELVQRSGDVCAPAPTTTLPSSSGATSEPMGLDFIGLLLWVLLIAAVVALVALIASYLMRHYGNRGPKRVTADDTDDEADDEIVIGSVAVDRSREPVNWRAEAEAHRAAGRFRDAVRCRYRALVGDLARRGLIDEIPGRTSGEERVQLRGVRPAASRPFEAAADLFDDAWYGHVPLATSDDDRFQQYERDVLAAADVRR